MRSEHATLLGQVVTCRRCGDAYLDKGCDTPARRAFAASHGSHCARERPADNVPVEVSLAMLTELAQWEPRVGESC